MRAKNLKFTYKNVCNFIAWLTRHYRNKYQDAPWVELNGQPDDKIAQERWERAMANTCFAYGMGAVGDVYTPSKQQLCLDFGDFARGATVDDSGFEHDAFSIPAELSNHYVCA